MEYLKFPRSKRQPGSASNRTPIFCKKSDGEIKRQSETHLDDAGAVTTEPQGVHRPTGGGRVPQDDGGGGRRRAGRRPLARGGEDGEEEERRRRRHGRARRRGKP